MHSLKSVFLCVAAIVISGVALAAPGDPQVSIVVNPVSGNEQVTLSRLAGKAGVPLVTYAAYRATITNNAASALNGVYLTGEAVNVGGSDAVIYDSAIVPSGSCGGVVDASNKVDCAFGSLAPRGGSADFIVVFRAPINGTRIDFNWSAGGFEGGSGGNSCCVVTNTASTTLIDPATSDIFKVNATTFVKTSGGKLFTGGEAITTSGDGWSTTVEVPPFTSTPLGSYTLATIKEVSSADVPTPFPQLACPAYALSSTCFASELTIPGEFAGLLKITIRWDKAFFNLGSTKPADVPLYYTGSLLPPPVSYPWKLLLCGTTGPSPGIPCLDGPPKILKSADTPVKDLWGDLQFNVRALDNGRYDPS